MSPGAASWDGACSPAPHSCAPNTFTRVTDAHAEFYALRDIAKGEELTVDYEDSHHNGTLPCRCGAPGCRRKI